MTDLAVLFHRCGSDAIELDRRARGFYDESLVMRQGARRRRQVEVVEIHAGDRLVLDMIGINHDPTVWADLWHSARTGSESTNRGRSSWFPRAAETPPAIAPPRESIALGLLLTGVRVPAER